MTALAALLRRELTWVPGVHVHDPGTRQCGIINVLKDAETPDQTRERLRAQKINVHVSRSPRAPALDPTMRGLDAVVSASAHSYNDEAERLVRVVGGRSGPPLLP